MHPLDCPSWEYNTDPRHRPILQARVAELLSTLASGDLDTLAYPADTREVHHRVFEELTPTDCLYYAGHYRGEQFRCLRLCQVGVGGDPRVGAPPQSVAYHMRDLGTAIRAGIVGLDAHALLPAKDRLRYTIPLACRAFVAFLTVHPYANGNGHMGRFLVWMILGRYGYWPRHWPVDPRPPDPPYTEMITRYRNGENEPLERYVLQQLIA